ncbi:MAG: rubrerythrin family protein, partial [Candidatus Altiarchaeota archaeon]|nr:rubrerythrin family protein [Candidatus Altiarchaeota archaeon]
LNKKTGKPGQEISVETGAPTVLGNTVENLKAAIAGENHEHTKMYPEFANIAEKEGLSDIAKRLRAIAKAEEHHEERFGKLLKSIKEKAVFKKDTSVEWFCTKCGYAHTGTEPPAECPSCSHPIKYFQLKCEEY